MFRKALFRHFNICSILLDTMSFLHDELYVFCVIEKRRYTMKDPNPCPFVDWSRSFYSLRRLSISIGIKITGRILFVILLNDRNLFLSVPLFLGESYLWFNRHFYSIPLYLWCNLNTHSLFQYYSTKIMCICRSLYVSSKG